MNRLLLTLLALMTGLVAQVSPVQAAVRAGGEAEIGSVQAVRSAVQLARQVAVRAAQACVAYETGLTDAAPLPRCGIVLSGVRIGIDRTRE